MFWAVVSLEGRAMHLATLVREAEQRVAELVSRVTGEAQGEREELKSWEWRLRLYRRMETGFQHSSEFNSSHTASTFTYPPPPQPPQPPLAMTHIMDLWKYTFTNM